MTFLKKGDYVGENRVYLFIKTRSSSTSGLHGTHLSDTIQNISLGKYILPIMCS